MDNLTYEVETRFPVDGEKRHEFDTYSEADAFAYGVNGSDELAAFNDDTHNFARRVAFGPRGRTKE